MVKIEIKRQTAELIERIKVRDTHIYGEELTADDVIRRALYITQELDDEGGLY